MLDLDHLSRQTLGNLRLEREVLSLFLEQAEAQVALIRATSGARTRREAAHALLGAARAIGAGEVERQAGAIERLEGEPSALALDALARAVSDTARIIRARLAG